MWINFITRVVFNRVVPLSIEGVFANGMLHGIGEKLITTTKYLIKSFSAITDICVKSVTAVSGM